jgi:hypothetical protein
VRVDVVAIIKVVFINGEGFAPVLKDTEIIGMKIVGFLMILTPSSSDRKLTNSLFESRL